MRRLLVIFGAAFIAGTLFSFTFIDTGSANPGAATYTFACQSAASSSSTQYRVTASVPPHVQQGEPFTLGKVVLSGAPDVPLLIVHMHVVISVSAGANVSSLAFDVNGPGSTNPPGPVAQPGVWNSTDPQYFVLEALGAPGSSISFTLAEVSSTIVNPNNPSQTLPVTCTYSSGPAFAVAPIIPKQGKPTTTTSAPATTTSVSSVTAAPTTTTTQPSVTTTTAAPVTTTTKPCRNPVKPCSASAINAELIGHSQRNRIEPMNSGATLAFGMLVGAFALTLAIISRRARA
jgi:hypothetical protein